MTNDGKLRRIEVGLGFREGWSMVRDLRIGVFKVDIHVEVVQETRTD